MHTCPFCDEVCDCDGDDTWGLPVPDDCPHVCAEDYDYELEEWEEWEECVNVDYMAHKNQRIFHIGGLYIFWQKDNFWRTVKIKYDPPSPNNDLPF